jgi:predicted acyltransferase
MVTSQRFIALDVLRGMTVCFMIIVNTPGNGATTFSPLHHAHWHGFTPTDLVFPSFLFVTGNALSFVMTRWATMSNGKVTWKILKRTILIFLLGYLMYWFPFFRLDENDQMIAAPISETRIMGVLQRIALCYGIAALMLHFLKPKVTVIISVILLFLYWNLLYWFGDTADPLSMTGNAAIKLDKWLMGEDHMYHGEGFAFDPEGWLSTLPAIGNVVGGYLAGRFVQQKGNSYEGLTKLLLAGAALLLAAYCWDLVFPVNKKLWTSSFVVLTVGLDCIILAAIIYVTAFLHKTRWTWFFEVFGKNPLFIYLLSELLVIILFMVPAGPGTTLFHWIYRHIFSHAGAYLGSLLFAIAFMLLCWSVGYWMDKRKIYIRV